MLRPKLNYSPTSHIPPAWRPRRREMSPGHRMLTPPPSFIFAACCRTQSSSLIARTAVATNQRRFTLKSNIAPDSLQVDERIEYIVRYEPIKELVFEVPSDFPLEEASTEISLLATPNGESENGEQRTPLVVEPIADENDTEATGTRRLRATLPQPRIGKFAIAVRYQIPRSQANSTLQCIANAAVFACRGRILPLNRPSSVLREVSWFRREQMRIRHPGNRLFHSTRKTPPHSATSLLPIAGKPHCR